MCREADEEARRKRARTGDAEVLALLMLGAEPEEPGSPGPVGGGGDSGGGEAEQESLEEHGQEQQVRVRQSRAHPPPRSPFSIKSSMLTPPRTMNAIISQGIISQGGPAVVLTSPSAARCAPRPHGMRMGPSPPPACWVRHNMDYLPNRWP